MARAQRPSNRYELLTCAWRGHVVFGMDADRITGDDHLLAREIDGVRWLRCLRCDGWFGYPISASPTGGSIPTRDKIEIPVRGPLLRDRYILSPFKAVTLVINVVIVVYLLLAKRLFGARGGHRVEMKRRERLSGWEAIERATPQAVAPV